MDLLETINRSLTFRKKLHLTIALVIFNKWITGQRFQPLTLIELIDLAYKQNKNSTGKVLIYQRTQNYFTTADRPLPYG